MGSHIVATNGHAPRAVNGQWLDATEALLEQLRGRMSLIQPQEERYELTAAVLDTLCREQSWDRLHGLSTDQARREFLQEFLSYDLVEEFLDDPAVEDILINSTEPIYEHKTGEGLVKTSRQFTSNRQLAIFVKKLIVFGGRSEVDPINDVELFNIRGRVNIIHSPFGPQITITRSKPKPLTILQLIESDMLPYELAAQLWLYVEGLRVKPANLLIAGGPGTGKTTLLNALLSFIPSREQQVTTEATLERNTPFLENCSRLESCRRVKTAALVKNSLRMRPERILVGEVRGEEARDLMTTMNLGKYCMGTLHASSARETILRLQNEPMNVPPLLVSLIDVFVVLRKLSVDGRVVRVVGEMAETAGMEHQTVLLSPVWTYDRDRRQVVAASPSSVFRDRLATESGRTPTEIMEETARRASVLKLMQDSGLFADIEAVTQFCQLYIDDPGQALGQLGVNERDLKIR